MLTSNHAANSLVVWCGSASTITFNSSLSTLVAYLPRESWFILHVEVSTLLNQKRYVRSFIVSSLNTVPIDITSLLRFWNKIWYVSLKMKQYLLSISPAGGRSEDRRPDEDNIRNTYRALCPDEQHAETYCSETQRGSEYHRYVNYFQRVWYEVNNLKNLRHVCNLYS